MDIRREKRMLGGLVSTHCKLNRFFTFIDIMLVKVPSVGSCPGYHFPDVLPSGLSKTLPGKWWAEATCILCPLFFERSPSPCFGGNSDLPCSKNNEEAAKLIFLFNFVHFWYFDSEQKFWAAKFLKKWKECKIQIFVKSFKYNLIALILTFFKYWVFSNLQIFVLRSLQNWLKQKSKNWFFCSISLNFGILILNKNFCHWNFLRNGKYKIL